MTPRPNWLVEMERIAKGATPGRYKFNQLAVAASGLGPDRVLALLALIEEMAGALEFYGAGKVDHEPDIKPITNGGVYPWKVSPYYGDIARKTLDKFAKGPGAEGAK